MKKVLIVDDHPLMRSGLRELLNQEEDLDVCGEAADVSTAVRLTRELRPDLVIVDITLADRDGFELIRELRQYEQPPRMLVCSMHDERIHASRAIRAGAGGYISKSEPADKILEAARTVLDGRVYLSQGITSRMMRSGTDALEPLSDRELQILRLIGQGLNARRIAKQLRLSVKTVYSHRERIKSKLSLKNANELVSYAVTWNLRSATGSPSDTLPS